MDFPKDYVFLNYLRCHDDIGWGLDYATLQQEGIEERSHKKYLNDYFQVMPETATVVECSIMRTRLPEMPDSVEQQRLCAGIEKAGFENDRAGMKKAIQLDVMLHAYMFMQSGIPVLYSGEKLGR